MSPRPETRRVWVLPNRNTTGLVALLVAMWYAGASQGNGAAYLLGFVLASVAAVSSVHTWANLRGIIFRSEIVPPAFAGDELNVTLHAHSIRKRPHSSLRVTVAGMRRPATIREIPSEGSATAELRFPAMQRGIFDEVPVRLSSLYPLGFFTGIARLAVPARCVVFPKAEGPLPLPTPASRDRAVRTGANIEGDDFAGVRMYRLGESQRHIDWKAVARGQPMMIKQWAGDAAETLAFDWEQTAGLNYEARLSQLAAWLVATERASNSYSLKLPGSVIKTGRGHAHLNECLTALAAMPAEAKS